MDEVQMGISKIGNLFAANVDALGSANKGRATAQSNTQVTTSNDSEAAVVSASFGQSGTQTADTSRQGRVAELKALVASGGYSPSSKDIAVAVIRDIG